MPSDETWRPSLALMDRARIDRLHAAAVEILETTGLNVHHPDMRRKLALQARVWAMESGRGSPARWSSVRSRP